METKPKKIEFKKTNAAVFMLAACAMTGGFQGLPLRVVKEDQENELAQADYERMEKAMDKRKRKAERKS